MTPSPFNSIDDGLDRGVSQFLGDYLGLAWTDEAVYPCYLSTQNGDSAIFVHRVETEDLLGIQTPTPGTVGESNRIQATDALPGGRVLFFAALRTGSETVPGCPGVTLDLDGARRLGSAEANFVGTANLDFFVPPRAAGREVFFQAGSLEDCRKSRVVAFTF